MTSSAVPGSQTSFLATDPELPSASTYFLHTPLPDYPLPSLGEFSISITGNDADNVSQAAALSDPVPENSGNLATENSGCIATETSGRLETGNIGSRAMEPGNDLVSPPLPLLLNPELMKGTGIHIVSPQVHVSCLSFLEWNRGMPAALECMNPLLHCDGSFNSFFFF